MPAAGAARIDRNLLDPHIGQALRLQLHLIGVRLDPTVEVPGDERNVRMEPDSRRRQSNGCERSERQHRGDRDQQPLP